MDHLQFSDRVLCDLKYDVADIIRDMANYDLAKSTNDAQSEKIRACIRTAQSTLEMVKRVLRKVQDVDDLESEMAMLNLKQCFDEIEKVKKDLEAKGSTDKQPTLKTIKNRFDELEKQLEDLDASIASISERGEESFRIRYTVRHNARNIFLDFTDENSPESQLKEAIFDKRSKTVSAVSIDMGGAGKTCALRAIALHRDAKARFPHGIMYMSLGAEAGKETLVKNLAMLVKQSGGRETRKEVESAYDFTASVDCAAEWFEDRNCLFIIDDISCQNGIEPSVTRVLTRLASHQHSKIAFTTRDNKFDSDISVTFGKRNEQQSKKMLLLSAGLDAPPQKSEEVSAFEKVLKMADGVPIALNVIGGRAKYLIEERKLNQLSVWSYVWMDYEKSERLQSEMVVRDDVNAKVLNILSSSLDMIDDASTVNTYRDRFAGLCIFSKRQEVPFDVLERIWGLSAEDTQSQIELYERLNMVEISTSQIGTQVTEYITMHDLLIDVSRHLAKKQSKCMERTSKGVIYSYVDEHMKETHVLTMAQSSTSVADGTAANFVNAWVDLEDDGFALTNVFHLLRNANMFELGFALLSDPRWLERQLLECDGKQVDNDIEEMLTLYKETAPHGEQSEVENFLRMIRATISEAERFIVKSLDPGMYWTQMYGRLYHHRDNSRVSAFLQKIEANRTCFWIKSHGAFPAPVPSSAKVLDLQGVCLARFSDPCVEIVAFDEEENTFELSEYSTKDDVMRKAMIGWMLPSNEEVGDVSGKMGLSQNASTLVTAAGYKVFVLDEPTSHTSFGSTDSIALSGDSSAITALTISADGSSVVSGDEKGKVLIWKKTGDKWKETTIGMHNDDVCSIAVSHDGTYVVSGSEDKTAIIWKRLDKKWTRSLLQHNDEVSCCAMSNCGSTVVTGSRDRKVRVWTEAGGQWEEKVLDGSWNVHAIRIGEDKNVIVCGTRKKVVVYERQCEEWRVIELQGHTGFVTSVGINEAKREIVSAAVDGTVRVWDVRVGKWEKCSIEGHTNTVYSVAVSRNRAVSGDWDGNLNVWDLVNSEWTRKSFQVARGAFRVYLSTDTRLVRVKFSQASKKKSDECYVERDGHWEVDGDTDVSSVAWDTFSEELEQDLWPLELADMSAHWWNMYEMPGGLSFAVTMKYPPYFDIVQCVNRPSLELAKEELV